MALRTLSGGPIQGRMMTFAPTALWLDPHVGDLVIGDGLGNYSVAECADLDAPIGIVRSVSPDSRTIGIEILGDDCIVRVPYDGVVGLGNHVRADHTAGAGYVEAGGAVGLIVGIDLVPGFVDVYCA